MLDTIIKSNNKKNDISSFRKTNIDEILNFYSKNKVFKQKYGLEYERLSLDKDTLLNVDYPRISKVISEFAKIKKWDLIYDFENIIGAKDNTGNSISLEPGCQLEISLKPFECILDIDVALNDIVKTLDDIASTYNVIFVGYGINPKNDVNSIKLLNKKRYILMDNYLPNCYRGELCQKMMRQTAGIQINVDYKNQTDAFLKVKFFNLIMPFISALFSNSPIENDRLSEYKSVRSFVWRYTGAQRCNMFYKNIYCDFFAKKNFFKNYIEKIFDVPMIFIQRDNRIIDISGKINFREFMQNGYSGYFATYEDYILHQSLCFPDVRLKNYIEIRNHDSNKIEIALALCAFYKGILQNNIRDLIKKFNFLKLGKIDNYYDYTIKYGLDFDLNSKYQAWDIVAMLFTTASSNLSNQERMYLNPIYDLIKNRTIFADNIIKHNIKTSEDIVKFYLS